MSTAPVPDFGGRIEVGDGSLTPGWAAAGAASVAFLLGLPSLTILAVAVAAYVAWDVIFGAVQAVKRIAKSLGLDLNDSQAFAVLMLAIYGAWRYSK